MLEALKQMLTGTPAVDYADLKLRGAQIVDVRSPEEFRGGHVDGALNIPLPTLPDNLKKLRIDRPVITCCASGMRSASGKSLLERHGFEVVNGGPWASLARELGA
jgi:phage shock protein E